MDYRAVILLLVALSAVCTADQDDVVSPETCTCPWYLQEFEELRSDINLLKEDISVMKSRQSEGESEEEDDNEHSVLVGDIVSLNDDATLPTRPAKIEGFVYATCKPMPNSHLPRDSFQPISGIINMRQHASGGNLTIDVYMYGFRSSDGSFHGFHIHTYGDLKEGCQSTGGHYNPHNKQHGGPLDDNRHVGDLGNVQVRHGVVDTTITDNLASLVGAYSVFGRSFVIHAGTDDLGRGGFSDSLTTGHAGARLACCVIGRSEQ